jgi:hypothetical protein
MGSERQGTGSDSPSDSSEKERRPPSGTESDTERGSTSGAGRSGSGAPGTEPGSTDRPGTEGSGTRSGSDRPDMPEGSGIPKMPSEIPSEIPRNPMGGGAR